jgi:hypothetical protein
MQKNQSPIADNLRYRRWLVGNISYLVNYTNYAPHQNALFNIEI